MFRSIIAIAALVGLLSQPQSAVAETYVCYAKNPSDRVTATFTYTYERVKGGFNSFRVMFQDDDEPFESERFYGDMITTVVNDWASYTNHLIERENSLTFLTWHVVGMSVEFIDLEEMQFQSTNLDRATHDLKYTNVEIGTCVRRN